MPRASRSWRNCNRAVRYATLVAPFFAAVVAASPIDINPPDVVAPSVQSRPEEGGAFSINEQTGAANYTYKFIFPPARGPAPELQLTYTSSGPTRGDIAQGWTLNPVAVVRRDVQREKTPGVHMYTAHFGGAIRELVPVNGDPADAAVPGQTIQTYRARIDDDFTRFEMIAAGGTANWIVHTLNGRTFYFGDNSQPGAPSAFGEEYYLSHVVDVWGNTASYQYTKLQWPMTPPQQDAELVLSAIEYTSNAGLTPHARIELNWALEPQTCATNWQTSGLALPVGATVDYQTGARRIRGTQRLASVVSKVRDNPGGSLRRVRQWTLHYDYGAGSVCQQPVSPRRHLVRIDDIGFNTFPGVEVLTTGPGVSFTYGAETAFTTPAQLTQMWPLTIASTATGAGDKRISLALSRVGHVTNPVYAMLADMDGDGRPDLVRADGSFDSNGKCVAKWYRNTGGSFDMGPGPNGSPGDHGTQIMLPTPAKPSGFSDVHGGNLYPAGVPHVCGPGEDCRHDEAECNLAGAYFAIFNNFTAGAGCFTDQLTVHNRLHYQFLDVDGDGKTDLVVQPYANEGGSSWSQEGRYRCLEDLASYPQRSDNADPFTFTCPGGKYLWRYYRNLGSGVLDFAHPVNQCNPVAMLGVARGDRLHLIAPNPTAVQFAYQDLNGDHLLDLITLSYVQQSQHTFRGDNPSISSTYWCSDGDNSVQLNVYLGTATGVSATPIVIPLPSGIRGPTSGSPGAPTMSCAGDDGLIFAQGGLSLVDMNNDGLADLVYNTGTSNTSEVQVYFNSGFAFDPNPNTILSVPPGLAFDPRDLDGDGIPDFGCLSRNCATIFGSSGLLFGFGAGFADVNSVADSTGRTNRIVDVDNSKLEECVRQDFFDLTGDGVPERYTINVTRTDSNCDAAGNVQIEPWSPNLPIVPDLLATVTRDTGATISFTYTVAASDPITVQYTDPTRPGDYSYQWPHFVQPSRHPVGWVVKSVTVADGNGVNGTTSYTYFDPVFATDDARAPDGTAPPGPRKRFRGFQAVVKTLPAPTDADLSPIAFNRYDYALDSNGRLDHSAYRSAVRQGDLFFYQTDTISQTIYASESMFGSAVRFVHPSATVAVECPSRTAQIPTCESYFANAVQQDCSSLPNLTKKTIYGYSAFTQNNTDLFWKLDSTTQCTLANDSTTPMQRQVTTEYVIRDNVTEYLSLPKRRHNYGGSGSTTNTELAREEFFYDGSNDVNTPGSAFGASLHAALTKHRVFRNLRNAPPSGPVCTQSFTCADYGTWYDSTTGNVVRDVKPSTMAKNNGDPSIADPLTTSYTYDAFGLFRAQTMNESVHAYSYAYDNGTGAMLKQLGPMNCSSGTCDQRTAWNGIIKTYDGLGRLLTEMVRRDSSTNEYKLIHQTSYPSLTTARDWHAVNWEGSLWTYSQTSYDGLGRVIDEAISTAGSASAGQASTPDVTHDYTYDARGLLITATAPDPSDDAARVTHSFVYDNRDRITARNFTSREYPTGVTLASFAYAPWQKTMTDADQQVKAQFVDGFGQLRQVQEHDGGTIVATSYDYDGLGQLSQVTDADGKWTKVFHDAQGHRTTIQRMGFGRFWDYQYDLDGNLTVKEDPDGWVTLNSYNERGNLTQESMFLTPSNLSDDHASELGIGGIDYQYDAPSGSGQADIGASQRDYEYLDRLERPVGAFIWFFNDGNYAQVAYGYDPQGNVAHEDWTLLHPQTGTKTFQVRRNYNALGKPENAAYPSGLGSPAWTYDGRGAVQSVSASGGDLTPPPLLASYQYGLAGQIRTWHALGDAGRPSEDHEYHYDTFGRVTSDVLILGAQHVNRSYTYSTDGDVLTAGFDDLIAGLPQQGTMAFSYDGLHRMRSAATDGRPEYTADLTYSGAGRIQSASISGAINVPNRGVGYVYAEDGVDADVQAVKRLTVSGQPDLVQFSYDRSGNMTSRVFPPAIGRPDQSSRNMQYEYDYNDQLRRVTKTSDGLYETYMYGPERRRFLELASDGTWRFQIGAEYEYEHKAGYDQATAYIGAAGGTIARLTSCVSGTCQPPCASPCQSITPEVTILHDDSRGDLIASFGQDGQIQSHTLYGAFGETLSSYQNVISDWRRTFNGKEQDQIDGLSYYGHRYYDPLTLLWTSADPLLRVGPEVALDHRLNLYAFSLNNPLKYRDPDGLVSCEGETQTTCARKIGRAYTPLRGKKLDEFVEVTTGQQELAEKEKHTHGQFAVPTFFSLFAVSGLHFETREAREGYREALATALGRAGSGDLAAQMALADLGRLAVDEHVDVHVTTALTKHEGLDAAAKEGGSVTPMSKVGPLLVATVIINPKKAEEIQREMLKLRPGPLSSVIAHEVGHLTGLFYHGIAPKFSNVPSLYLENVVRSPLGLRLIHTPDKDRKPSEPYP